MKTKTKQHVTAQELNELGFAVIDSYSHDDFVTEYRQKGCIILETTWQMPLGNFVSQNLQVEIDFVTRFSKKDLEKLDEILNKKTETRKCDCWLENDKCKCEL